MPVRPLDQRVLKWPDRNEVIGAAESWAQTIAKRHEDVAAIGYFGSYATGDEGVGSDLDVIVIVDHSSERFERRALQFSLPDLPVPVDVIVYTKEEWTELSAGRMSRVADEIRWLYRRNATSSS